MCAPAEVRFHDPVPVREAHALVSADVPAQQRIEPDGLAASVPMCVRMSVVWHLKQLTAEMPAKLEAGLSSRLSKIFIPARRR